ncbi:dihydrolipoamide acetyltransferase family protein [Rhizomonospora bruguierae]|uniref:dihydrolipoamide acetyltransferase family protein n=1 Tax=Rhizomonospora bruguierae TaxID=1581705 RepID=UPI001BCE4B7B|nr:dihydrolipoamide acetyltransferase family protein [Micromonospora sp. NBRC 107566]
MSGVSRIRKFEMPDLGEGLTEGEILRWFVKVGDTIAQNQPIVEVETAKAAVEIPAKWPGRVTAIFHEEGATVDVGAPIIAIDTDPEAGDPPADDAPADGPAYVAEERTAVLVGYGPKTGAAKRRARKTATNGMAAAVGGAAVEPAAPPVPAPVPAPAPAVPVSVAAPVSSAPAGGRPAAVGPRVPVLAKPPVRKLAKDLGVDLTALTGSGPLGSITREDVQAATSAAAPAPAMAATAVAAPAFGPDREQRTPIKGVRKLTAENMVASAFTAPHVTEFLTVDVTRGVRALDRLRERAEWRDARISPLLLVAKAVLLGIRRYPMINSTWSAATNEIIIKEYVNLGIAAATERGLIVPNIKDAGRLTLRDLADELTALVRTAKAGRTSPADMAGGTFSITNVGVFGVDTGTPILPPGEAAILALGAIREQPWVHKGKIRARQVTTLGMSFDHRIIDGELGSKFLRDVGAFLSDPEAALLAWT